MLKNFLIFSLCIFAYLPQKACSENNYFSNPCLYSSEELAQKLKEKDLNMSWHFGQDSHFCFLSRNDEIYFEICLGTLSDIYNDMISSVRNKFIQEKESKRLLFSYKVKNEREEVNIHKMLKRSVHPNEYSYLVTDRRIMENAKPQQISKEKLAEIIEFKKILFYTGAGISALEVPTMDELHQLLGLETHEKFLFSLENILGNPREFASKIRSFHKACVFGAPTKAHLALKELAVLKNIRIITENLDSLHEASGIYPYRVDAKHLREEIGEALTEFDYVIAIGLKLDDRGFLGWYKKQNPQGTIIAVNLMQPPYLGDEDFLIIGDLQEIIPKINAQIKSKP